MATPVTSEARPLATHPVTQVLQRRARVGSRPGARDDGHRVALVLEGGGMRGVVSAGMTAAIERLGLTQGFDLVAGASAGAINGAALLAGAAGRAVATYTGPLASRAFVNPFRLLRGKPVLDVNDILKLATGLESAGHDRITSGEVGLHAVAVDVESARTVDAERHAHGDRGVGRTARLEPDAVGRRAADRARRAPLPRRQHGLADPGGRGARGGRDARAGAADAPVRDPAQEQLAARRPLHRAPPARAQPRAGRALPRPGSPPTRTSWTTSRGAAASRATRRRSCSACGRRRARRASASSSATAPCWPAPRRTRTGSSRPRSARPPPAS